MPSRNDLSGLKIEPKNTLIGLQQPDLSVKNGTPWRYPKPPQEKQSQVVGLRFTPSEIETLKKHAGLVPLATFIRDQLMSKTDILK